MLLYGKATLYAYYVAGPVHTAIIHVNERVIYSGHELQ